MEVGVAFQIGSSRAEAVGIISRQAQHEVALSAQRVACQPCLVAVVTNQAGEAVAEGTGTGAGQLGAFAVVLG